VKTLEQVLIDARGELPVLRKHGQSTLADAIEHLLDDVAEAGAPFLEWLSEGESCIRSDHAAEWLRRRFPQWERQGLARWHPRRANARQYLKVVVPLARNLDAVRADAAREAGRLAP